MSNNSYDYNIKLILVGISGVGKSNLILRQVENRFDE
jgi:GTPase SAR1 family protein